MFDSLSKRVEPFFKGKINKENCLNCSFIGNSLVINQDGVLTPYCLFKNNKENILDEKFNFLWLDTENLNKKFELFKTNFKEKYPTDNCVDCLASSVHLENNSITNAPIKKLYLSHWICCPFNCLYCERKRIEDISFYKHYDIMPVINQLLDTKLIDKKTQIIFECGDATLHPDFDRLLYYLLDYGMKNIVINTTALRFCQSVADALGRNCAKVYIPIDAGTNYLITKIKQLDKVGVILLNIERYLLYQEKNSKNIIFKYTLTKGINDYTEGLLEFFLFTKNSKINKFCLDIDDKWFYEVRYEPPAFLQEIISFAENLAKINNFDFEFSDKINYLYSKKKEIIEED